MVKCPGKRNQILNRLARGKRINFNRLERNAWFLGLQKIDQCIKVAAGTYQHSNLGMGGFGPRFLYQTNNYFGFLLIGEIAGRFLFRLWITVSADKGVNGDARLIQQRFVGDSWAKTNCAARGVILF